MFVEGNASPDVREQINLGFVEEAMSWRLPLMRPHPPVHVDFVDTSSGIRYVANETAEQPCVRERDRYI